MPFYKVPTKIESSQTDSRRVRAPLRHPAASPAVRKMALEAYAKMADAPINRTTHQHYVIDQIETTVSFVLLTTRKYFRRCFIIVAQITESQLYMFLYVLSHHQQANNDKDSNECIQDGDQKQQEGCPISRDSAWVQQEGHLANRDHGMVNENGGCVTKDGRRVNQDGGQVGEEGGRMETIVECEIRLQAEREAELASLRETLYKQKPLMQSLPEEEPRGQKTTPSDDNWKPPQSTVLRATVAMMHSSHSNGANNLPSPTTTNKSTRHISNSSPTSLISAMAPPIVLNTTVCPVTTSSLLTTSGLLTNSILTTTSDHSTTSGGEREHLVTYEEAISSQVHPGESLIAREIREHRRREEELHRQWQQTETGVSVGSGYDDIGEKSSSRKNFSASINNKIGDVVDSRSSNRNYSRTDLHHSEETLSSNGGSNQQSITVGETTDVRRNRHSAETARFPLVDPHQNGDLRFLPELEETPIEKEMRLARGREDALRKARGIPVDVETRAAVVQVPTAVDVNLFPRRSAGGAVVDDLFPRRSAGGAVVDDHRSAVDVTMKKLASNRLQIEIEKEKQRELDLRSRDLKSRDSISRDVRSTDGQRGGNEFKSINSTSMQVSRAVVSIDQLVEIIAFI